MTPTDGTVDRGLLAEMLAAVPDGVLFARIYLPEKPNEDAVLEYDGKKVYFAANRVGSSDSSQVTPKTDVPESERPCL